MIYQNTEIGASRDENIHDRIAAGILDKELSRNLQLMADLTLTLTMQTIRPSEEVAAQVSLQGDTVGSVQEVRYKRKNNWKPQQQQGKSKDRKWGLSENKCGKCGKAQQSSDERCPAKKATCHNCHKMGHWARVCRNSNRLGSVCSADG